MTLYIFTEIYITVVPVLSQKWLHLDQKMKLKREHTAAPEAATP